MTKLISYLSAITVIYISLIYYPFDASAPVADIDGEEQRHCDRKICDSIVTKCTLSSRCTCDDFGSNPTCAKDCIDCLEEKFDKCCACVGSCPVLKDNIDPSHVGEISPDTDEQLFTVLTESDDIHGRWSVDSMISDTFEYSNGTNSITSQSDGSGLDKRRCLMAFINKHLHMDQCKRYCRAMGASYFQWFHDGCCECAGKYCLKYGIPHPRCLIDPE